MTKQITASQVKLLRASTGAPMLKVRNALVKFDGDEKRATAHLKKEGFKKAAKRADRETSEGVVAVYKHHNGKVAALVELLSETDFVAKNEIFISLANDLALQAATSENVDTKKFLKEEFIKDPSKKVEDLIKEAISQIGENIQVGRICKIEIGK